MILRPKQSPSNLSETGLFIATDQPAEVGDRLSLRLALSRDSGPLEMQGEIKYGPGPKVSKGEEVLPAGWGIEFVGGQELGIIRERVRQRIKEIQAQIAVMLADGRRNNQAQLALMSEICSTSFSQPRPQVTRMMTSSLLTGEALALWMLTEMQERMAAQARPLIVSVAGAQGSGRVRSRSR